MRTCRLQYMLNGLSVSKLKCKEGKRAFNSYFNFISQFLLFLTLLKWDPNGSQVNVSSMTNGKNQETQNTKEIGLTGTLKLTPDMQNAACV